MDPSMLIGFLIKDKEDWLSWRRGIKHVQGKAVVSVCGHDPAFQNRERLSAIDEVEVISDEDEGESTSGLH
jgi:cysteine protease ATG4